MLDDPDDLAILEGVLGLATAFRRQVIAEGVETVEHGAMLLQLGCELAQGYGIARPMPAHDIARLGRGLAPRSRLEQARLWSTATILPLLFASVEHRAWIVAIEGYLKGERKRRRRWITTSAASVRGWMARVWPAMAGIPAFQAIEPLHRQVHALAISLCEHGTCGRKPEAMARLGELHDLRDTLLARINELLRHGGP